MKLILVLFLSHFLLACAIVNPVIGYEKAFRWHLDELIGQSVSTLEKEIYSGQWDKIKTVTLNEYYYEIHLIHRASKHQANAECLWSAKIESNIDIIESWRYLSDSSLCKLPYFYEGAW